MYVYRNWLQDDAEGVSPALLRQQVAQAKEVPVHQGPTSTFAYPAGMLPGDGLWAFLQPCPDPNRPLELRQLSVLLPPTAVFPGDAAGSAPFLLVPGPMGQVQVTPHVSEATVQHAMGDSSFPDDPTAVLKWAHRAALPALPTAPAVAAALQTGVGAVNALQFTLPKRSASNRPKTHRLTAPSPYAAPVLPGTIGHPVRKADRPPPHLQLPPLPPTVAQQLQGLHVQQRSAVTVLATRDISPCVAHGISVSVPPGSGGLGGLGGSPDPQGMQPSTGLANTPSAAGKNSIGGRGAVTAGVLGVPPTGMGFVIQKLVRCRGASPFVVRALWRHPQRRHGPTSTAPPSMAWMLSSTARYGDFALGELASALTAASRAEDAASAAAGTTAFLASVGGRTSAGGGHRPAADAKTLRSMFWERLQSVLLVDTSGDSDGMAAGGLLPATAAALRSAPAGSSAKLPPPLGVMSAALTPFALPAVPTLRLQKLSAQGSAEVLALTGGVAEHISAASGLFLSELMVDWTRDEGGRWWMLAPKAYRVQGGLKGLHRAAMHPPRPPSTAHIPAAKALWKAHSERLLAMGGQRSTWRKGVQGGRAAEAAPAGRSGEARLKQLSMLAQAEGGGDGEQQPPRASTSPSQATSALGLREQARAEHSRGRTRRSYRGQHRQGGPTLEASHHSETMTQLHKSVQNTWAHAPHAPLLSSGSSASDSSSAGGDSGPEEALPIHRSHSQGGTAPPRWQCTPHYSADVAQATRSAQRAWAHAASEAVKGNRLHMQGLLRGQQPPPPAPGGGSTVLGSAGTLSSGGGRSSGSRSATWGRTQRGGGGSTASLASTGPTGGPKLVGGAPSSASGFLGSASAPRTHGSRRAALAAGVDAASTVQYGAMMAGNVLQEHMPPLELTPPGQAFSATGGMAADVHTSALRSKKRPPSGLSKGGMRVSPGSDSDASEHQRSDTQNTRLVEYSQVEEGEHGGQQGGGLADIVGVAEPSLDGRPPHVSTALGGGTGQWGAPQRHGTREHTTSVRLGMPRATHRAAVVQVKAGALGAARQQGIPSAGGVRAAAAAESDAVEIAMQHLMQDRSAVHRVPPSEAEHTREGSTVIAVVQRDAQDAKADLASALGVSPSALGAEAVQADTAQPVQKLFSVGESTLAAVRRLADGIHASVQGGAFAKNDQALRLFAASGLSDLGGNEATRIMARAQLQAVHTHLMGQLARAGGRHKRQVQWAHAPHVDASGHVDPADVTTSAGERSTHPCACCGSRLPIHKLPFALTAAQQAWLCKRLARRLPPAAVRSLPWLQRHLAAAAATQPLGANTAPQPAGKVGQLPLSKGGFPEGGAAVLLEGSDAESGTMAAVGVLLEGDFAQLTPGTEAEQDVSTGPAQTAAQRDTPLLLLEEARMAISAASAPAGSTAGGGEAGGVPGGSSGSGAIASRYELMPTCTLCYELHEREVAITRTEAVLGGCLGLQRTLVGHVAPTDHGKAAGSTPMSDTSHAFVRVLIALDGVKGLPLRQLVALSRETLDALAATAPLSKQAGTTATHEDDGMGVSDAAAAEARLASREAALRSRLCALQSKHAEFSLRHAVVRLVAAKRRLQRAAGIVRSGGDLAMWWSHQQHPGTKGGEGDEGELPAATLAALQQPDERATAVASLHLDTAQLLDECWPHVQEVLLGVSQGGAADNVFSVQPPPPGYVPGGHASVTLRGSAVGRRSATVAHSKGVLGLLRLLADRGSAVDDPAVTIVRGWQADLQHAAQLVNTLERSWGMAQADAAVAAAGAQLAQAREQALTHRGRFRGAFLRVSLWGHCWQVPLPLGNALLQAAARAPQYGSAGGLCMPSCVDVPQRQVLCVHALAPGTRVNVDIPRASSHCGLSCALGAEDTVQVQLCVSYWGGSGGWQAAAVASAQVPLAPHRYLRVPFASHSQSFRQLHPRKQHQQSVHAAALELHPFVAGLVQSEGGSVSPKAPPKLRRGRAPPAQPAPARGEAALQAARTSAAARARARRRQHSRQLRLPGGELTRIGADGVQPDLSAGPAAVGLESESELEHVYPWHTIPGGAASIRHEAMWGALGAPSSSSDSEDAQRGEQETHMATNSDHVAWSACCLQITTGIQIVRDDVIPLDVDASLTPPSEASGGGSLLSHVAAQSGEDTNLGHMPPRWAGWSWHAGLGLFLASTASSVRGWGAAPIPPSWCRQLPPPLPHVVAALQTPPQQLQAVSSGSLTALPAIPDEGGVLSSEGPPALLQYPTRPQPGSPARRGKMGEDADAGWSAGHLLRVLRSSPASPGWVQLAPGHRVSAAVLAAQSMLASSGRHTATSASVLRQAALLARPSPAGMQGFQGGSPQPSVRRPSSATSHGRRRVSLHDVHADIVAAVRHAKGQQGDASDAESTEAPASLARSQHNSLPLEARLTRHLADLLQGMLDVDAGYCTWHICLAVQGVRGPPSAMQRLVATCAPQAEEGSEAGRSGPSRGLIAEGGSGTARSTWTPHARTNGTLSPGVLPAGAGGHFPPRTPTLSPKRRGQQSSSPGASSDSGESFVAVVRRMVAMRQGLKHWVRARRDGAAAQPGSDPPELRLPGRDSDTVALQGFKTDVQRRVASHTGTAPPGKRPPSSPGARSLGGETRPVPADGLRLYSGGSMGALPLPRAGSSGSGFGGMASHRSSDRGVQGGLHRKPSAAVLRVLEEADGSEDRDGSGEGEFTSGGGHGVASLSSGPLQVDAMLARYGISAAAAQEATRDSLHLDSTGSLVPMPAGYMDAEQAGDGELPHVSLRGHRMGAPPPVQPQQHEGGVCVTLWWGDQCSTVQLNVVAPADAPPSFQAAEGCSCQVAFQLHGSAHEAAHMLSRAGDEEGRHVQLQLRMGEQGGADSPGAPLSEEVSLPLGHAALEAEGGVPAEWSAMLDGGQQQGALAGVYVYGTLRIMAEAP